jgi:uncharacterized membrane protein YphA (DoxX/SURF4 family)
MKTKLLYWIPTVLIALFLTASAVPDVLHVEGAVAIIHHLGYPDYFLTLIGVAKLLGAVALLAPVPRTLREWAYAGFTFDLLGAAFSHASVGDPMSNVMTPLIALAVLHVSHWAWRHRGTPTPKSQSHIQPTMAHSSP